MNGRVTFKVGLGFYMKGGNMKLNTLYECFEQRRLPFDWLGHWYARQWHMTDQSASEESSFNPNDGSTLMTFSSTKSNVDQAIQAAAEAVAPLVASGIEARFEYLRAFYEQLSDKRKLLEWSLRFEAGKPAWEARWDVDSSLRYLAHVLAERDKIADDLLTSARMGTGASFELYPVGVCAAYLPFSTPITSFVVYYTAAAIAGCPLVIFSSRHATLVASLIAAMDEHIDSPSGSLGVVFSGFDRFKYALTRPDVGAVLYTGSHEHCAQINQDLRGNYRRQLVLQSGGKNPAIVHSTADMRLAVSSVLYGAFSSAGQQCSSTSRAFVYRSLLPQFMDELQKSIARMEIGRSDLGEGPGPAMGPLFSKSGLDKFLRFQTMANREAAETVVWGRALEAEELSDGYFVTPGVHLMESYDSTSAYQSNVLFCPDLAIYPYDVLDEAIAHVNDTHATHSVAFFGEAQICADRRHLFQAPNLLINAPTVEAGPCLPLAGRTQYGRHRYQGMALAWYLAFPQALVDEAQPEPFAERFSNFP